ncbi:MAG: aminoacyl-tRNA hydrolase [Saprospiraceae bacterium]|nr:aminoacyl-tRNA hydrolase [Saprospiraceae bacterium]
MESKLIVGLGNIGPQYKNTRHNLGFEVIDTIAGQFELQWQKNHLALMCNFNINQNNITLIKPTTFMNESGKAVLFYKNRYDILKENILVISDDLHLPFSKIRLKLNSGDGGHNGLKSINVNLSSYGYPILKIGIGANYEKGKQIEFVSGQWDSEEMIKLPDIIDKSAKQSINFIYGNNIL